MWRETASGMGREISPANTQTATENRAHSASFRLHLTREKNSRKRKRRLSNTITLIQPVLNEPPAVQRN